MVVKLLLTSSAAGVTSSGFSKIAPKVASAAGGSAAGGSAGGSGSGSGVGGLASGWGACGSPGVAPP